MIHGNGNRRLLEGLYAGKQHIRFCEGQRHPFTINKFLMKECRAVYSTDNVKVVFIIPYFGKLPNYYQLFLDSCARNVGYDWLIITNDETVYEYPQNVHRVVMNFEECKKIVQSKFSFPIVLNTPHKLCDYKCAYGYIFQEYIVNYDFWGHCDLDMIFGNLSAFITDEMLNRFDKIGSLGHLTLYRNTRENNSVFMKKVNGIERYKEVFSTEIGCAFDEWLPGNINEIYIEHGEDCWLQNYGADINSYKTVFSTVDYDVRSRKYILSDIENSIFLVNSEGTFQLYIQNGVLCKKEFAYVHLQKRKMKDCRSNSENYYIVPNKFIECDKSAIQLINRYKVFSLFNYQWLKVKYSSFKLRLKTGNWRFNSVFSD